MRISDRVRHANIHPHKHTPHEQRFWVRHPHIMGAATVALMLTIALLLAGCQCGVGWPCPQDYLG